jgi:hypothetical protein
MSSDEAMSQIRSVISKDHFTSTAIVVFKVSGA